MFYRTPFDTSVWRFRTPFEELENMRRQMSNLFGSFADGPDDSVSAGVFPAINLTEDKENYYVRAEIPGVKNDDLELNITDNTLTLAGERKIPEESGDARYHRRERRAGNFTRAIAMPGEIDADKVEASLVNGILTVTVAKAEKQKPRQITVK